MALVCVLINLPTDGVFVVVERTLFGLRNMAVIRGSIAAEAGKSGAEKC
jgi:hypothetical protein